MDPACNFDDERRVRVSLMANHIRYIDAETWDVAFEDHELDDDGTAVGYEGSIGGGYRAENIFPGRLFEETAFIVEEGFGHLHTICEFVVEEGV